MPGERRKVNKPWQAEAHSYPLAPSHLAAAQLNLMQQHYSAAPSARLQPPLAAATTARSESSTAIMSTASFLSQANASPRWVHARFERAVDIIQALPREGAIQTSYDDKLMLYSVYKQGTCHALPPLTLPTLTALGVGY